MSVLGSCVFPGSLGSQHGAPDRFPGGGRQGPAGNSGRSGGNNFSRGKQFQDGKPVAEAVVVVEGKDKDLLTSSRGEWWRILVPGTYKVWAHKDNWRSPIVEVEVKEAGEEGHAGRSGERRVAQRRVVHSHGPQDHNQEGHTQKHSGEAWGHVDLHLVSSLTVSQLTNLFFAD